MLRPSVTLIALCALIAACGQPGPPREPVATGAIDYNSEDVLRSAGVDKGAPFYDASAYDPAITPPGECLGHPLGQKPAEPARVLACFRRWAEQSPRMQVARYAVSHEGRDLIRAVVAKPEHLARLDDIKRDIGKLADPRKLAAGEAERIIASTPAIGWFGYSIHGDELSGVDASLAFAYHLIAGGDSVAPLLDQVVVVIDPSMNPDGRQRTINFTTAMSSHTPSGNYAGRERWSWPGGRGNHYLFDLNRDWIIGVHPETRGRWAEILSFNPQLFVDAHEMGELDTYLFSPKNKPYNPGFPASQIKWYKTFADDIAAAFDRKGWAYYTREWSGGWFPGYSSTWGPINGAIGFLYEQASTNGLNIRRPSGALVTYRDSIRGHAVASLVNLGSLARHREQVLRDYLSARRQVTERTGQAFVLVPGRHPDRERALLAILMRQRIEVHRAEAEFKAREAVTSLGEKRPDASFPAGSYVIFDAQPQGNLVRALLDFDPRQDRASLLRERREIEQNGRSRIYDLTSWNLGHAFALDAYWTAVPKATLQPVTELPKAVSGVQPAASGQTRSQAKSGASGQRPDYAWIVDGREDGSPRFAAEAMSRGLSVHLADEAFDVAGRQYAHGSVLVRISENPTNTRDLVDAAARAADVPAYTTLTGRAPGDGVDLGGRHFQRLNLPRVALLANSPLASNSFGHVWHHLDRELGLPITLLDLQNLRRSDLRRYNVIVIPDAWGDPSAALGVHKQALTSWLHQGGTLIAMGGSAFAIAKEELGLSKVRLRRDSLDRLPIYDDVARRNVASRTTEIDERALWDGPPDEATAGTKAGTKAGTGTGARAPSSASAGQPGAPGGTTVGKPGGKQPTSKDAAEQMRTQRDAWERRFFPHGVMLRTLVDQETWVTAGAPARMPVLLTGEAVFLAPDSVRTAVRFDRSAGLRLSGLLWPEARARIAHSAYLTTERVGRGQVVLFAFEPVYRGLTRGTGRLFSNAVIYGPGMVGNEPLPWRE